MDIADAAFQATEQEPSRDYLITFEAPVRTEDDVPTGGLERHELHFSERSGRTLADFEALVVKCYGAQGIRHQPIGAAA